MSLPLHDYELDKFGSLERIKIILSGKDCDYVLKHAYLSENTRHLHCLIRSLANWQVNPTRPENYYLIIYKHGSPSYLTLDRDCQKPEYQRQKLTKNQFRLKELFYRFSSEVKQQQ